VIRVLLYIGLSVGIDRMPNWKELRHAYGPAEDLPQILSALTPDPKARAWRDLWSRVCHQGTTYSASPAVLPFLLDLASSWNASERALPLSLAGAIVSAPKTILSGYEPTVERSRILAVETAKAPELSRTERIYAMESALALGGDRLWGRALNHLEDGEFPGVCPACGKDFYVVTGKYGFFSTAEEWLRDPKAARNEIQLQPAEALTGAGKWLHNVSTEAGDSELGEWCRYLFGSSKCPHCGQPFEIAAAIAGAQAD
jgi:uncharacterized protein (UPF0212 family)